MIGECAYARFNKQCAVRSLLARFFMVIVTALFAARALSDEAAGKTIPVLAECKTYTLNFLSQLQKDGIIEYQYRDFDVALDSLSDIAGVVQIKGKTGRGNRFEKALVSRIVSDCYPNEAEAIVNRNDKNWGMTLQNIIEKIERRNVDKIYIKVDGTDVHVYTNAGKFWGESPVTK